MSWYRSKHVSDRNGFSRIRRCRSLSRFNRICCALAIADPHSPKKVQNLVFGLERPLDAAEHHVDLRPIVANHAPAGISPVPGIPIVPPGQLGKHRVDLAFMADAKQLCTGCIEFISCHVAAT
jgi:hypothetical protein